MENNRYQLVEVFGSDVWMRTSPVEVREGALILDTLKNMHCLQLSLVNTSSRRIVSVHVEVDCFDNNANRLLPEPVVHIYQDTLADKGAPFGLEETFYLNSDKVAKVKCYINKIVFLDGAIWRPEQIIHITAEPLDQLDPELRAIFDSELAQSHYASIETEYKYLPVQHAEYWLCTCGRANENNEKHCVRCGMNRTFILQTLNVEYLKGVYKQREERRKKAEQEREAQERAKAQEQAESAAAAATAAQEEPAEPAVQEPETVHLAQAESPSVEELLEEEPPKKSILTNKFVIVLLGLALLGSLGYIIYLFITST